jgi:hypothetical protein
MFPHFLCIGAQKAGTTWLHQNLSRQPGIWLPPVKELHFLDHRGPSLVQRLTGRRTHLRHARAYANAVLLGYVRGRTSLDDAKQALRLGYGVRDWDWYESLFPADPALICGEVCPGYARLPNEVIARIVERNPRVRVLYLLRDPIDRAWSGLAMHFRKAPGASVDGVEADAIVGRLVRAKSFTHCEYKENIERWQQHLPAEQLYVGFFERIASEPAAYLTDVLSFLGATHEPDLRDAVEPVNAGRGERMDPALEQRIARTLLPQALAMHRMFANVYTARWLEHAQTAANATR